MKTLSFSEILVALWRRKLIILAVTVLAAVVAGIYLQRQEPEFQSTSRARVSAFMTNAIGSGLIAGVPAEVDPTLISTPVLMDQIAEAADEPVQVVSRSITQEVVEGTLSSTLVVTAKGPSPEQAYNRVRATMTVYSQFLDNAVATTLGVLGNRIEEATNAAHAYQAQLAANPADAVASANLTAALSEIGNLNVQMSGLRNAGPPLTITVPAQPGVPIGPGRLAILAVALLCGLIAGAGIALIRDHFDDRLRNEDEIEPLTGAPVLAVLANDRRVARRKVRLPAASRERTALGEGLRSLRTAVQVLLPEGKGVFVVTSVEPGDGKTFVSANLAVSWARAGRSVILIGGDLRRPELDAYFPTAAEGPGLGGLLADVAQTRRAPSNAQIAEALRPTAHRGLRVLPPGHADEETADQLAGLALSKIVGYVAKHAEIVVIDSPPALALADASDIGQHADGVVVLSSIGRTRRALLEDTVGSLVANDVRVFGVVANRSRRRLPRRYASYYGSPTAGSRGGRERDGDGDGEIDPDSTVPGERASSSLETDTGDIAPVRRTRRLADPSSEEAHGETGGEGSVAEGEHPVSSEIEQTVEPTSPENSGASDRDGEQHSVERA